MAKEKVRKPRYKADPRFSIEDFCDNYHVYRSDDKEHNTLCCTYNVDFHMIYVGKGRDEEAIEELKRFLEHKNFKDYRITYTKTKEENLEDTEINEQETEPKQESFKPVRRGTRKTRK